LIETTQSIQVEQDIGKVWAYAKDVERWAEIMPGYQQCEIIDDNNSLWILKIGVGAIGAAGNGAQTDVALHVEVNGTGPMAPMWEAMGGPVLPKFAAGFARQLKERIEAEYGVAQGAAPAARPPKKKSLLGRFWAWLRSLFR
jgi:carbon monoxide dehydrogenase subunit G